MQVSTLFKKGRKINMNKEFTYKITSTITQNGTRGTTSMLAECIEDNIIVGIVISNSKLDNKEFIKKILNKEHENLLKEKGNYKNCVQVGDIV
jgi:ABC-type iron transport system FetAB ATPase subunit